VYNTARAQYITPVVNYSGVDAHQILGANTCLALITAKIIAGAQVQGSTAPSNVKTLHTVLQKIYFENSF